MRGCLSFSRRHRSPLQVESLAAGAGLWHLNPKFLPTPGNLPNPVIEPASLASPDLEGGFFTTSATWEAQSLFNGHALMYLTLEYTVLESKNYLKGLESEL